MKMTFRWFGEKDDCIQLWQVRQIPGAPGIVGALFDVPVGEVWPVEKIAHLKATVEAQGDLIKSMQAKMDKMAGGGAGRKAVLSVVEKPAAGETLAKSQQEEGLTPAQVMAKANAAFDAKRISGQELVALDVGLRSGALPDQAILAMALA